jgi:hypothetical protein
METLPDIYASKINSIMLKTHEDFKSFNEYRYDEDFILQVEKDYILSCEKLILYYLKQIKKKILTGQMKPWKTCGDAKISVFSGTYDYPTMAHLLLMLDHLADSNTASDFLIIFLEPDKNNKPDKNNNFDTRERLIKTLIEPYGDLIRYFNYGRDLKYFDVICKLMNSRFPEVYRWTQIIGSDVFNKHKAGFSSQVEYWKDNFGKKRMTNNPFSFDYCVYNRGEKAGFITNDKLIDYSRKYKVSVKLKTSPLDRYLYEYTKNKNVFLSATAFKKSLLRIAYPSIINILYAGYQLLPKYQT